MKRPSVHRQALRWLMALIFFATLPALARADSLTLDQVLSQTLANNPAIQQAKARVEEAAGRRLVIRANNLPYVRIGGVAGGQGGSRAGADGFQPFAFAVGSFRQPLFDAAAPARSRRANTELLIAQQQLNLAVVEQLHSARVAFYTAIYNRSLQSLREEQRGRLDENLRSQLSRYESGVGDRGVVATARLQAQELGPRIETSRRALAEAQLKLAQVTGGNLAWDAEPLRVDGELQFVPKTVDVPAESAYAIRHRADLQLARLMIDAAGDELRIVEAGYFPAVNAVVDGRYIPMSEVRRESQGGPSRSDDVITSDIRAGGAYTWRVIDNGRVAGAAMEKRKVRELNELTRKKLEANVSAELGKIENSLRSIAARRAAFSKSSAVADENVQLVQQSLAEGLASQLESRAANYTSLESRSGLLQTAYENNVARAELDRATGRYFQFSQDTAGKVD